MPVALVATVLFNQSYSNADIERYYLGPALFAWTWLAVLAATVMEVMVMTLPPSTALSRMR